MTLKRDSGGEPAENVTVNWELLSPDGSELLLSGTELTSGNGKIGPIKVIVPPSIITAKNLTLTSKHKLPLKVTFSKVSESVIHTFLCEDETVLCPDDGIVTYLSHLNYRTLIHAADSTMLLLEGNVYSGRKDPVSGLIYSTGCPLSKVQVCLMRKMSQGEDISQSCSESGEIYVRVCCYFVKDIVHSNLSAHQFIRFRWVLQVICADRNLRVSKSELSPLCTQFCLNFSNSFLHAIRRFNGLVTNSSR